MSTHTPKQFADDEVDLASISNGIGNFFNSIGRGFFNLMQYAVRNILWILLAAIAGVVAGYLIDRDKLYEHHVILRPNFNSTEHLYSKVSYLSSVIGERDKKALESLGIKEPHRLVGIKLSPVVDVYNFVSRSELNFKTLELLAEDGDLNKIVVEPTTSKNYAHHSLTITTSGKAGKKAVIDPIIKYFNSSDYYRRLQAESVRNLKSKMQTNEVLIGQIDAILASVPQRSVSGGTVVNSESQLNDVIRTKDLLIEEQGRFRVELLNLDQIIKPTSTVLNIERNKGFDGKMKYVLPLVFVLAFIVIHGLFLFYRRNAKA